MASLPQQEHSLSSAQPSINILNLYFDRHGIFITATFCQNLIEIALEKGKLFWKTDKWLETPVWCCWQLFKLASSGRWNKNRFAKLKLLQLYAGVDDLCLCLSWRGEARAALLSPDLICSNSEVLLYC